MLVGLRPVEVQVHGQVPTSSSTRFLWQYHQQAERPRPLKSLQDWNEFAAYGQDGLVHLAQDNRHGHLLQGVPWSRRCCQGAAVRMNGLIDSSLFSMWLLRKNKFTIRKTTTSGGMIINISIILKILSLPVSVTDEGSSVQVCESESLMMGGCWWFRRWRS